MKNVYVNMLGCVCNMLGFVCKFYIGGIDETGCGFQCFLESYKCVALIASVFMKYARVCIYIIYM